MPTIGAILGTPYYIAAEIWNGKPATDVYSLACVAFAMLTGRVLFEVERAPEIMTKHIFHASRCPDNWPVDVPPGMNAVLEHALEKDPAKRYQTALSFDCQQRIRYSH